MPKPRPTEKKQEFIPRCMNYLIRREGKQPKQARAICESYWKNRKK